MTNVAFEPLADADEASPLESPSPADPLETPVSALAAADAGFSAGCSEAMTSPTAANSSVCFWMLWTIPDAGAGI